MTEILRQMRSSPPRAAGSPALSSRTFWLGVVGLCALAAGLRLAILAEFLRENPVAEEPWTDGKFYWQMAGRIAEGHWLQDTPFLSPPLYPYLLAAVRALGGGLKTVYGAQLVLHLATAVAIAGVTRLRFGPLPGLVAGGLFLALTEPAISSTRILASTLQLLIATILWWQWSRLAERKSRRWWNVITCGAWVGLLALAYPPAMLLVPIFAVWLWWSGRPGAAAPARAIVGGISAILVIAPATIHNALASGEFIAIAAHAGITLAQGNGPNATGVWTQIRGISTAKEQMHLDAARLFERVHGRPGAWGEVDRYFRQAVFAYWKAHPLQVLKLLGAKLYFFLTWYRYDDITPIALEREFGVNRRAVFAPLPVPWLMGAAAATLIGLRHRLRRYAPEVMLIAVPLLVTMLFFYTPRYRIPAIAPLCGLAGYAVARPRRLGLPLPAAVALSVLPPLLTLGNRFVGPDELKPVREDYRYTLASEMLRWGDRYLSEGNLADAERRYRRVVALCPDSNDGYRQLGYLYLLQNKSDQAMEVLRFVIRRDPQDATAFKCLYNLATKEEQYLSAASYLRRVAELQPDDVNAHLALAWLLGTCPDAQVRDGGEAIAHAQVARERASSGQPEVLDVLAAAYAEAGRFADAVIAGTSAAELVERQGDARLASEITQRVNDYRDGKPCRAAPRLLPIGCDGSTVEK